METLRSTGGMAAILRVICTLVGPTIGTIAGSNATLAAGLVMLLAGYKPFKRERMPPSAFHGLRFAASCRNARSVTKSACTPRPSAPTAGCMQSR
jgi:hypothetical protein